VKTSSALIPEADSVFNKIDLKVNRNGVIFYTKPGDDNQIAKSITMTE